jgi:hypothetical protein
MEKLLSNSNTKLKKDGIFAFGIPAGITCPFAGACKEFCYAKKGSFRYPVVKAAQSRRWEATKQANFPEVITAEIKKRKVKRLRIHDSGDFYSRAYLAKWVAIAELNPETQFYAYSKSLPYFQGVTLPSNLRVIFSQGGKHDAMIDVEKHRHARIFDSVEALQAAGYVDSHATDLPAATDESLKIGLVFH